MKDYTTVEARDQFSDVINQAAFGNKPVGLTRHGRKIAVVLGLDEYQKLLENQKND